MPDKILGRVLDQHNLGADCFVGAVRCYWGSHGDYCEPAKLYAARKTVLHSNPRGTGTMKPILYCAKRGDAAITRLSELKALSIIHEFTKLN